MTPEQANSFIEAQKLQHQAVKAMLISNCEVNDILHKRLEEKLDEIIHHQKITNGRVTKLEENTKVTTWIQNNKIASLIAFIAGIIGITVVINVFGVLTMVDKLTNLL